MSLRALAVHAQTHPDDSLPPKELGRAAQQRAEVQEYLRVEHRFQSPVGRAVLDKQGLLRVNIDDSQILCIPGSVRDL